SLSDGRINLSNQMLELDFLNRTLKQRLSSGFEDKYANLENSPKSRDIEGVPDTLSFTPTHAGEIKMNKFRGSPNFVRSTNYSHFSDGAASIHPFESSNATRPENMSQRFAAYASGTTHDSPYTSRNQKAAHPMQNLSV